MPKRFTLRVGPVDPADYHGEAQALMPPVGFQLAPQFLVDIADEVLVFFHDSVGLSLGRRDHRPDRRAPAPC